MNIPPEINSLFFSVPSSDSPGVERLCSMYGLRESPQLIPHSPIDGYSLHECHSNVSKHVSMHGGKEIVGWVIWNNLNLFLEAEQHAVWENPQGQLIDITPDECNFDTHLFIPDSRVSFAGYSSDNLRFSLSDNPLVAEYISLKERIYSITLAGTRVGEKKTVELSSEESMLYYRLQILEQIFAHEYLHGIV